MWEEIRNVLSLYTPGKRKTENGMRQLKTLLFGKLYWDDVDIVLNDYNKNPKMSSQRLVTNNNKNYMDENEMHIYNFDDIDKEIYSDIMSKKPQEWDEKFADLVYADVEKHKYFITNLGKCTQVDARVLPNSVYSQYLDLLRKEIEIINPKTIITLGNQVSSIVLDKNISVSQCRKQNFLKNIAGMEYKVYPVYYPIGNGMMNIDKAIEDLNFIIKTRT